MNLDFTSEHLELRKRIRTYYEELFTPELRRAFDEEFEEINESALWEEFEEIRQGAPWRPAPHANVDWRGEAGSSTQRAPPWRR